MVIDKELLKEMSLNEAVKSTVSRLSRITDNILTRVGGVEAYGKDKLLDTDVINAGRAVARAVDDKGLAAPLAAYEAASRAFYQPPSAENGQGPDAQRRWGAVWTASAALRDAVATVSPEAAAPLDAAMKPVDEAVRPHWPSKTAVTQAMWMVAGGTLDRPIDQDLHAAAGSAAISMLAKEGRAGQETEATDPGTALRLDPAKSLESRRDAVRGLDNGTLHKTWTATSAGLKDVENRLAGARNPADVQAKLELGAGKAALEKEMTARGMPIPQAAPQADRATRSRGGAER